MNKNKRNKPNRGNQPKLSVVHPELEMRLIKLGNRLVYTYVRDENSLPVKSDKNDRDGWVLHPRKGWRRVSNARRNAWKGRMKIDRFLNSMRRA